MSKKKTNKNKAEAKASAAAKEEKINQKPEDKKDEKNSEEWLEEELEDVELEENNSDDTDELMKKAAQKIEDLQKDSQEWQNKYMRLHAEWDTYRRRINEQREQEKLTATEGLVTDILPVLDDFERSIDYAKQNGEEGLLDGVCAVYSKLVNALEKSGVEVLNPENKEAFDSLEHQAVATVEDLDAYEESVASVMQKGYKMGKKVIRAAMVSVTTGGKARPKPKDEEEEEK